MFYSSTAFLNFIDNICIALEKSYHFQILLEQTFLMCTIITGSSPVMKAIGTAISVAKQCCCKAHHHMTASLSNSNPVVQASVITPRLYRSLSRKRQDLQIIKLASESCGWELWAGGACCGRRGVCRWQGFRSMGGCLWWVPSTGTPECRQKNSTRETWKSQSCDRSSL